MGWASVFRSGHVQGHRQLEYAGTLWTCQGRGMLKAQADDSVTGPRGGLVSRVRKAVVRGTLPAGSAGGRAPPADLEVGPRESRFPGQAVPALVPSRNFQRLRATSKALETNFQDKAMVQAERSRCTKIPRALTTCHGRGHGHTIVSELANGHRDRPAGRRMWERRISRSNGESPQVQPL
jgi:hypothetical protein